MGVLASKSLRPGNRQGVSYSWPLQYPGASPVVGRPDADILGSQPLHALSASIRDELFRVSRDRTRRL
jgi:hypothetical protein